MSLNLKSPYFFALDVDSDAKAIELAKATYKNVGGFKLGPRLCYRYGAELVNKLSEMAPVFVDNKYHDIPSTMIAALRASFEAGASYATIHAACGKVAMQSIAQLEKELNSKRPFRVLAVTVLTSMEEKSLPSNWRKQTIEEHVLSLAQDVYESGLRGLVCSPHEVQKIRAKYSDMFVVVPGIRMPEAGEVQNEDQSRVATAAEALQAGASALVIGRLLLNAADPALQSEKIAHILNAD